MTGLKGIYKSILTVILVNRNAPGYFNGFTDKFGFLGSIFIAFFRKFSRKFFLERSIVAGMFPVCFKIIAEGNLVLPNFTVVFY